MCLLSLCVYVCVCVCGVLARSSLWLKLRSRFGQAISCFDARAFQPHLRNTTCGHATRITTRWSGPAHAMETAHNIGPTLLNNVNQFISQYNLKKLMAMDHMR